MPRQDLIELRGGTAAEWASVNPVLAEGEPGVAIDGLVVVLKIGNGVTAWNALPIANAVALSEFLGDVASEAAMLALSGNRGDWAIRTDTGTAWVLVGEPSSEIGSWQPLPTMVAPIFPGPVTGQSFAATGLPGATNPSRHVGGTASGPPSAGTFAVGDFVVDAAGIIWTCTVAGTPGTWEDSSSSGHELAYAESSAVQSGITAVTDLTNLSIDIPNRARPIYVELVTAYTFVLTASSSAGLQITDAAGNGPRASGALLAANAGASLRVVQRLPANSGPVTRKGRLLRSAGTGTITNGVDATYVSYIRAWTA